MIAKTICPMDCPDACALEVEVEDGRVVAIGGSREHPDTAGFICGKVADFRRRLEHRDRVLRPLRRVRGKGSGDFEPIGWEDAIGEIADRLGAIRDRWGGEAIAPFHYGGSNGLLTDGLLDALFFDRLGASRLEQTICAVPTTLVALGMYGRMPGVAFADHPEAECIIVWGANPKASNIHLVPYLKRAKARGTFIATVDPRNNFSASETDLHLPVRPGTDLVVALSMIDLWRRQERFAEDFLRENAVGLEPLLNAARQWPLARAAETAGVEARQIEQLAAIYAAADPALIRCGWGLERNRNGGQAVAAILAIPALLGKFGKRGGGYLLSNGGAKSFARDRVIGRLEESGRRRLNMTQLGRWLDPQFEPPVKALFVYNANPVATVPCQDAVLAGLSREDLFTVVSEQVMTDTARCADIVLPAVTFLEGWDLKAGYGSYVLGGVRPVIEPMGECRTNQRLFADLGRAMGFDEPVFAATEQELFRQAVAALSLDGKRPDAEVLLEGGLERFDHPGPGPVQFDSVRPRTPDGKIHLTPAVLGERPFQWLPPVDDFPLALISPASGRLISSSMGEYNGSRLCVDVHPEDAAARGLTSGVRVRVFNGLGSVECAVRITRQVRPGVVSMPKGIWRRAAANGSTATALCPDHLNVVGGAACFNDARVDIEKL